MSLSDRVTADMKVAMKAGDKLRLETLRTLLAQIIELTKRGTGTDLTPDDELSVLTNALKKRREAIELYEKGGRIDLADQERQELEIIRAYLPKQLTRQEAEEIVRRIVSETGATSSAGFRTVMPLAMKELKGKIDGKIVQDIVKSTLGV